MEDVGLISSCGSRSCTHIPENSTGHKSVLVCFCCPRSLWMVLQSLQVRRPSWLKGLAWTKALYPCREQESLSQLSVPLSFSRCSASTPRVRLRMLQGGECQEGRMRPGAELAQLPACTLPCNIGRGATRGSFQAKEKYKLLPPLLI